MEKSANRRPSPSPPPSREWARAGATGSTGETGSGELTGGRRAAAPASPGDSRRWGAKKRGAGGQHGAAAVEFALVLPLFLVLWFGVMDFGLAMYAKGLITHASQEGARFGAIYRLTPLTAGDIQAHVQGYLRDAGFTDPVTVTVTGAGGSSGTPLTVRVDYIYHFVALPDFVAGLMGDLNLSAETVMRLE